MVKQSQVPRWTLVVTVLICGCSRKVLEEEKPVLVEHRVRPCTQWCTPLHSEECGAVERPDRTVEECVEECAAVEPGGWFWAHQEDGTDACAEEWFAAANCIDALSCEDQFRFFNRQPVVDADWPCRAENDALTKCFYETPSTEREDDDG